MEGYKHNNQILVTKPSEINKANYQEHFFIWNNIYIFKLTTIRVLQHWTPWIGELIFKLDCFLFNQLGKKNRMRELEDESEPNILNGVKINVFTIVLTHKKWLKNYNWQESKNK